MLINKYIKKSLNAGAVMLALACHKDDQSFTYDAINDIKIENPTATYTVVALDSLIITPKLLETMPSDEEYGYTWTLGTTTVFSTVSTKKDLRIKVELSPGSYYAILKTTSKKTGITAFSRYTVVVNGAYYGGWYVVHNQDGKGKASLIRTDDAVFYNPLEEVNKKVYPGKALAMYYSTNIARVLTYFTDQGVYRYNVNDLLELTNTSSTLPGFTSFPFKTTPYYTASTYDQYIIADGGLYVGIGAGFYPNEILKPFSDKLSGDHDLFPAVFPNNLETYEYDNKGLKFVQTTYLGRVVTNSVATTGSFDMANVGKKMIATDRGIASPVEYYFVMQNSTGRYIMSIIGGNKVAAGINQLIQNSPEIANATNFATSSILKQMYYSVDNKIYLYDILANSARLIYSFPTGYVIKDIEMLRSTSKRLVVATNMGTAGQVYYFDIDGLGAFVNNTFVKKFEGFGEISQVTFSR